MKKEARAAILRKLQEDYKQVRNQIINNRHKMAKLVQEQTLLKCQLPEYHALIRSLEK